MIELDCKMRAVSDGQNMADSSPIVGKVRRRRTVYSRAHLDLLLKTFETNPYPGISVREKLSHITGVHESRIQVWFQNRRARKNKKTPQEVENLPEKWPQPHPVASRVHRPALTEKDVCRMGFHEKESVYKHCAAPVHPLSHLHMNSYGPQHLSYGFPYQATNPLLPGQLRPANNTMHPYHPYVQGVSSSHLSHGSVPMERNHEYTSSLLKTPEPIHSASQESSLQDILEEFQPCWTEVADYVSDVPDDLLSLF
ncbi:homeobox protein Mix.1-like isoform X2 [Dendropsophus ebraccatus]|uniref:homeobox protein Mix.1-like isoform X2 n=1 Tax=Dendropsophus ebraccatus TaxID=150705 RepID=UPI003831E165